MRQFGTYTFGVANDLDKLIIDTSPVLTIYPDIEISSVQKSYDSGGFREGSGSDSMMAPLKNIHFS